MSELGERAVTVDGFRLVPGMALEPNAAVDGPCRVLAIEDGCPVVHDGDGHSGFVGLLSPKYATPDMTEPGTIGCFEHVLVPEAYGCDDLEVHVWRDDAGVWWLTLRGVPHELGRVESRGEALVDALELAPGIVARG